MLTPSIYDQLRKIAYRQLNAERRNHTLQATALVHEAWLKLASHNERSFADNMHFLAIASRVMRQILVDYARSRATQKREGELHRESLATPGIEACDRSTPDIEEVICLDDALTELAAESPRMAELVGMRYFGGLTAEESAEALGISVHIVRHELRFAQAVLRRKMSPQIDAMAARA